MGDSLGLIVGGGASEVVEADPEPLVDLLVEFEVFIADLARGETFLDGLRLRRRPVLVRPADVQRLVTPCIRNINHLSIKSN